MLSWRPNYYWAERTSPGHGTAFDIAGKGIADPRSMLAAIHLAAELINSSYRCRDSK